MEKRIAITLAAREHPMSMPQDLESGRPLEIDVLVCSIAEMRQPGRPHGAPIDQILDLARWRGIREV